MTPDFRASVRKSLESICRAIDNRDEVMKDLAGCTLAALRDANAMRKAINEIREHLGLPPVAWPERGPARPEAARRDGEGP